MLLRSLASQGNEVRSCWEELLGTIRVGETVIVEGEAGELSSGHECVNDSDGGKGVGDPLCKGPAEEQRVLLNGLAPVHRLGCSVSDR